MTAYRIQFRGGPEVAVEATNLADAILRAARKADRLVAEVEYAGPFAVCGDCGVSLSEPGVPAICAAAHEVTVVAAGPWAGEAK